MSFLIDKQTINDLELFDKSKGTRSIISLFSFTKSIGGRELMQKIFSNPLTDISLIENRIELIKYFQQSQIAFRIEKESLDIIEYYLRGQIKPSPFPVLQAYSRAIINFFKPSNEYYILQRGVKYLIDIINQLHSYTSHTEDENNPGIFAIFIKSIIEAIENSSLEDVLQLKDRTKFFPHEYARLNTIFRRDEINNVRKLLGIVYEIDVYSSVALTSQKYGFTLPAFSTDTDYLTATAIFHPFIDNPVTNDFKFHSCKRVCFITGPNMAGKSTFLKALSISIYLSHLGFPVPAKEFKTSIFNGLLTTINLSDNLSNGYSHYYNEVLRVKYIAEQINKVGNLFVVFDELFRGTNIKDAYEASLSIIIEFSRLKNSSFALSTHIIEVADMLKESPGIFFKYFEANLVDETPHYNYLIRDGVTNERIGMYILRKEKVLETIKNMI